MAAKQVRTLEERLRIIEEVEKNPTEKIFTGIRIDHFPVSIVYFQVS